jgi:hypothetical protein
MHTDPYDPLYDIDDEDYEFADHDPTVEDCVRLWHQAVEWFKHDTLYGVVEFAGETSQENSAQLRRWIQSVRQVRASALIDADTSYWLMWEILEVAADADDLFGDPQLVEIGNRMDALDLAHGIDYDRNLGIEEHNLPGWRALEAEWDARRLEMKLEVLRDAGEHTMVALMKDQADEFAKRQATVERRIKKDYVAEHARHAPLDDYWLRRLGLEDVIMREVRPASL